ncbi:hypothetical protein AV530_014954 [Patagioenas fasciata monilis]|uniref:Uncharacterized protein n=1 Tax=Patagioenas fasciata monilis TaxID=372326 RepID=A0A1V4K0F6_PATFA|nr:hypothetical protein AV530_014954 [Patagioenas fasciata monilis]
MPTAHIPEKSGDLLSVASQESQAQGNDLEALQIHLCIFVPSLQLRTNAVWKHRLMLQRKQLPQQTRKGEEGLQ